MPVKKKNTPAKKRKAAPMAAASISSSSSSSSSSSGSPDKKRPKRSVLPDGIGWMAPHFLAISAGMDMENRTQRHMILTTDLRFALKKYISYKQSILVKMQQELTHASRYQSIYRGLQRNGNAWAVLAGKEGGGNKGRSYVGTYPDEETAAREWDKKILEINGLSSVWKLNFPKDPDILKQIENLVAQDNGKIITWGGKPVAGQYRATKYHGVYEVLSGDDCDLAVYNSCSSSSSSSSSKTPTKLGPSRPLPAAGTTWLTGQALPYIAMARIGGRSTIIGKAASLVEAAIMYDEFADVVDLPMNNLDYEELRKARATQSDAAKVELARIIEDKGYTVSRSGKKKTLESSESMKLVATKTFSELKRDAREGKKAMMKLEKILVKNMKLREQIEKKKEKKKPAGDSVAGDKLKKQTKLKVTKVKVTKSNGGNKQNV